MRIKVSIISLNYSCAFMYYDLGMRYLSPTFNLNIEMNHFVKMIKDLKWYMAQELVKSEESKCPITALTYPYYIYCGERANMESWDYLRT